MLTGSSIMAERARSYVISVSGLTGNSIILSWAAITV